MIRLYFSVTVEIGDGNREMIEGAFQSALQDTIEETGDRLGLNVEDFGVTPGWV